VTRSAWLWPTIIVVSAAAAALVTFGDVPSPTRPVVALWFLFVCPGMAFVRLVRIGWGLGEWMLAVALSLAVDALVAGTMLYTGLWSPRWGLVVVIGICVVGAALQVALARSPRIEHPVGGNGAVPREAMDAVTDPGRGGEPAVAARSPAASRR
jgi:hypothetical protein